MKDKIAICMITKDEHQYLQEFIDYYKAIGVDDVILYDNEPKQPVVINSTYVKVVPWKTDINQNVTKAYADCAIRFKDEYKWICFFDSDEYLILKKHKNIKEFLTDYDAYPAVAINWLCFGSSDIDTHISHSGYNKHCRFDNPINTHVKSIIKPEYLTIYGPDPHNMIQGTVDTTGNSFTGPFSSFKNDVAYLKHCIMRTKEDYMKKANWGRIDIPLSKDNFRSADRWDEHYLTFNECQDEKKVWL
jgi:hypothetical protein